MSTNVSEWTAAGALLSLGALHGLNPGMGWLFAVALGMQGDRRAVWRALGPLALGHALAIATAVAIALELGVVLPSAAVRWAAATLLVTLGVLQWRGHRHPGLGRWRLGGLRATAGELTAWSFVVATAHGAGLMAAPFAMQAVHSGMTSHSARPAHSPGTLASMAAVDWPTLWATSVHTAGYLLVTAVLAVIVYERAAVHVVRRAWINFDLAWSVALVLTGIAVVAV
jgi:hypothetical protein